MHSHCKKTMAVRKYALVSASWNKFASGKFSISPFGNVKLSNFRSDFESPNVVGGSQTSSLAFNSEVGRMLYTISILLMVSKQFKISVKMPLLQVLSGHSSLDGPFHTSVSIYYGGSRHWHTKLKLPHLLQVETLLDAMRFREELDLQMRQKKRLRKAKKKVTQMLKTIRMNE